MATDLSQARSEPYTLCLNSAAARSNPWTATQDQILNAARLETARTTITDWDGYAPTPLYDLTGLAADIGVAALSYKDESPRFGLGSFKALGGAYAVARLLQAEMARQLGRSVAMSEVTAKAHPQIAAGVTVACATDGNHGRSVAWGAQTFGCACEIFIHATVSEGRRAAIAHYGARVHRCDGNYDDSIREAQEASDKEGWIVVSDTSYPGYMEIPKDVMQGYELMAAEAFDALDAPPTHIFLQTGVGGMAAAITALAVRRWGADRPWIVLCDPDQSACYLDSFRADAPVAVEGDLDTIMAGLACGEVSALAWEILHDHADAVVALTDASAVACMRQLAKPLGTDPALVAGESAVAGLAGLAALIQDPVAADRLDLGPLSRVLVFGTEGDTDPELYTELVGRTGAQVRQGLASAPR